MVSRTLSILAQGFRPADGGINSRGAGRALVETALAWCRDEGVARLVLWSDTRFERAHRLYDRMGFRRTGHRTLPGDLNHTQEYRFERSVAAMG